MNTEYVIVLEVDNKDAVAKYTEGLRGLDAIWDRVIKEAERLDKVDFERWETEYRANIGRPYLCWPKAYSTHVLDRKAERAHLIHKLDISKTAISPFKMAEGDVSLMNRWGDGSRVTELIKQYGLL